jgi:uncharacterized protein YcnI
MRTPFLKLALVSAAASTAVLLVAGGIASAHVDPDPLAMEAGTTGVVAFNVEHGCDGSPMTDLKIKIADGVTGVTAVEKPGWTATVTADSIEFKGGPLAADKPDHFDVTLTVPAKAGDLHFPAIETCEKGEIAWIEIPAEGAAEPEFVAPTLKVTQGPPTSADLTPPEEAPEAPATGDTAAVAATTAASNGSSNTGTIVVVVIVAAIVAAGGGILLVRRKNAAPKS